MDHNKNSEADLQFSVGYAIKEELGYDFYLHKYMGDTDYGKAYVDMLIIDKVGNPKLIIEFKMNSSVESGLCDCTHTDLTQYKKYCQFGLPVYTCNGYADLGLTIEYIKSELS